MEYQYNWKTRLFSKTFEIFQQDILKGELRKEGWSRKVTGELNARRIMFETKGVFKFRTQIIDMQGELPIGEIKFASMRAKTTIIYQDKEYQWHFDNLLRSKWSISDDNGVQIKYHSHAFTGLIVSYTRDEVLILTGFFIRNFLKQRTAEIAAST